MGDFLFVIIELFSLGAFVSSQFTRVTDRQTDGQTDTFAIGKTALHVCSAVKTVKVCEVKLLFKRSLKLCEGT